MGLATGIGVGIQFSRCGSQSWESYSDEDWYGIQIDESNSSPALTRIAGTDKMSYHATLPVHSQLKACLLNDDATVNYYLDPTDWSKKSTGEASNLDGTDGQVMIEWDNFYYKVDENTPSAGVHQIKISQYPLTGFTLIPKHYISAYQATVQRSTLKLSSVKNLATDYRGGDNDASKDAAYNTLLGTPAAKIKRESFRQYARNRGTSFNNYSYNDHKWLSWFFAIEYATLYSQDAVNGVLTAEGYKQGGLGVGVTSISGWDYESVIPCGASDSLASGSGEVTHTIAAWGGGAAQDFKVPRYRGHEHPFGHLYQQVDGVNISIQTAGDGGESRWYQNDNPLQWNDLNNVGYEDKGLTVRTSNWINKMLIGSKAELIPTLISANSATTYYCDKTTTAITSTILSQLRMGGSGGDGTSAGIFSNTFNANLVAIASTVTTRLSAIPLNIPKSINDKYCVIGDSTVAKYMDYLAISDFFGNDTDLTSIATAGETIAQQDARWDALDAGVKTAFKYVFIMVGLNDANNYDLSAASELVKIQTLINAINTESPSAKIILSTMTPAKQRFIDVLGAVNGATAYQKWLDMNEGIRGEGANAITGADVVISSHTTTLNDGSGNLAAAYNFKDNVHENNIARQIIANLWIAEV